MSSSIDRYSDTRASAVGCPTSNSSMTMSTPSSLTGSPTAPSSSASGRLVREPDDRGVVDGRHDVRLHTHVDGFARGSGEIDHRQLHLAVVIDHRFGLSDLPPDDRDVSALGAHRATLGRGVRCAAGGGEYPERRCAELQRSSAGFGSHDSIPPLHVRADRPPDGSASRRRTVVRRGIDVETSHRPAASQARGPSPRSLDGDGRSAVRGRRRRTGPPLGVDDGRARRRRDRAGTCRFVGDRSVTPRS